MKLEASSFRDPSSRVYYIDNKVQRVLHKDYLNSFKLFQSSGLKKELIEKKLILDFEEISNNDELFPIRIQPKTIPFISYPYEWSFNQLKSAALLTLEINLISLKYGMILKDSSVYNVQFIGNRAVFIDHASFEVYDGSYWVGYNQFCKHFYGPLLLLKYVDYQLKDLYKSFIDGVDLKMVVKLLPFKSFFNPNVFLHIFMHYRLAKKEIKAPVNSDINSKTNIEPLLKSLHSAISVLQYQTNNSAWLNYYPKLNNYNNNGIVEKQSIVTSMINKLEIKTALDMGGNTGLFSEILSTNGVYTLCVDNDIDVINTKSISKNLSSENLLILYQDICNPSPGIGWNNLERKSFLNRANFDLTLALALVHHLVFKKDIKLDMLANYFYNITNYLIIEYIPIDDSMIKQYMSNKNINIENYSQKLFEEEFSKKFNCIEKQIVVENNRTIYLYKRNEI